MKTQTVLFLLPLLTACGRAAGSGESQAAVPRGSGVAPSAGDAIVTGPNAEGAGAADPIVAQGRIVAVSLSTSPTQTPAPEPIDLLTAERVRLAFANDPVLAEEARGVAVSMAAGIVELTGNVKTEAVRTRMGVVAGAVGGVTRVQNKLMVASADAGAPTPVESAADIVLADRVRREFADDAGVMNEVGDVAVSAREGVVTLAGTVRRIDVHDRVVVLARTVGSVTRVDDRLTITGR